MTAGAIIFLGFCLVAAAFIFVSVKILQVKPDFVKKVLKYTLIFVFTVIFGIIAISIGFRINDRHEKSYSANFKSVQEIWGGEIIQQLPTLSYFRKEYAERENKKTGNIEKALTDMQYNMGIESQKVSVDIKSNIREKGLLKYPGYNLTFTGRYVLKNLNQNSERLYFSFHLPYDAGNITNIKVKFQDKEYTDDPDYSNGIQWEGVLAKNQTAVFEITYNAQGTEKFTLAMGVGKSEIKNLDVELTTDFTDNIIPDGAMVPTSSAGDNNGMKYTWVASNLVTGQSISLKFKISGNYGEIISKLFYYSPVALFLFVGLLLVFSVSKGINLHPMHYLFMITGFFIFYLLGSYMVSYMNIIIAILISLSVSTGIILYYTYLIKKGNDIIRVSSYGVLLFQWVFSTAFFVPEHTGFLITIASIVAFLFLIRSTASVDWENKW
ncbi:MAG: inner membrane CreD family protein [Leptospirales bacterium]|nr:inner membrane CreD family protein [Leptospirales bacterium]